MYKRALAGKEKALGSVHKSTIHLAQRSRALRMLPRESISVGEVAAAQQTSDPSEEIPIQLVQQDRDVGLHPLKSHIDSVRSVVSSHNSGLPDSALDAGIINLWETSSRAAIIGGDLKYIDPEKPSHELPATIKSDTYMYFRLYNPCIQGRNDCQGYRYLYDAVLYLCRTG